MLPMLRKSTFPNLFEEFFQKEFLPGFFEGERGSSIPAVNIIDEQKGFRIEVAAPGMEKKDFNIDLEHNVLTISSEKEVKSEEEDEKIMRKEFSYTSFSRSFSLPESVDLDKISAKYKDGVMTISIPKKEEAKVKLTRQIKIL